jgi:hypothetical protein
VGDRLVKRRPRRRHAFAAILAAATLTAIWALGIALLDEHRSGPMIERVSPSVLIPDRTATIRGRKFADQVRAIRVTVGGMPARLIVADSSRLVIVVPTPNAPACGPPRLVHVAVSTSVGTDRIAHPLMRSGCDSP